MRNDGLAGSTLSRLERLEAWRGSTSFLSVGGVAAADELGLEPVAQVIGATGGGVEEGVIRTVTPGQGRRRRGKARWLERTGPVKSWANARRFALGRMAAQAATLKADAVVDIRVDRRMSDVLEGVETFELVMTGTAVRFRLRRSRADRPLLTLASPQELLLLERAGLEPVGIAGASAHVQIWPGTETKRLIAGRHIGRSGELEDLSTGVYEARRLAMQRLVADAQGLDAAGLVGVELTHEHARGASGRSFGVLVSVHVLASAVRRRHRGSFSPAPALDMSGGLRG